MSTDKYDGPELAITKLDAAKRQLETAARLYFAEGDPVSIHTLTAAAFAVLEDLDKKRGGKGMPIRSQILAMLIPEGQKMLNEKMAVAENFFKHADRDPEVTLTFRPEQTEVLLLDAYGKYHELTGEQVPILVVFAMWFWTRNPKFLLPGPMRTLIESTARDPATASRAAFLQTLLPLTYQLLPPS